MTADMNSPQTAGWPPLNQGTLRERLTTARDAHAYAAGRVGWPKPDFATLEEHNSWHRECAGWYAEMLEQLDAIEATTNEALGYVNQAVELHRAAKAVLDLYDSQESWNGKSPWPEIEALRRVLSDSSSTAEAIERRIREKAVRDAVNLTAWVPEDAREGTEYANGWHERGAAIAAGGKTGPNRALLTDSPVPAQEERG